MDYMSDLSKLFSFTLKRFVFVAYYSWGIPMLKKFFGLTILISMFILAWATLSSSALPKPIKSDMPPLVEPEIPPVAGGKMNLQMHGKEFFQTSVSTFF